MFSGSAETQFNVLVSIFVLFNITLNILVGWISWKWRQRENLSQTVLYWSISFFCFGIIDLAINSVIIHYEPEVIQEALFPWLGFALLLGLDFYLFLTVVMGDILNLISSIPILGLFDGPIKFGILLAMFALVFFSIVLFPLMSVGTYYIGFRARNFWEKRRRNPRIGTE